MPIAVDHLISKMQWAAANGLAELSLNANGSRVTILRENVSGQAGTQFPSEPPVAPTVAPPTENSGAGTVTAPLSGICYLAPDSGASPFIAIGTRITKGETLCVIEAMKVMTPVTASAEGIVEAILVDDGASVTAGDLLVRIR